MSCDSAEFLATPCFPFGEGATTLELMGVGPDAAEAYRILLRRSAATVDELANDLEMSIIDVRSALRGLERRGLVERLADGRNRFRATPPDEALGPLVRRRQRELHTMRSEVDALRQEYALSARPYAERRGVAGDIPLPSSADLRLLRFLLEGLTDVAIASRLNVGERTVQRRVRDLIDLAGVQTRLQLIWQATRQGWI